MDENYLDRLLKEVENDNNTISNTAPVTKEPVTIEEESVPELELEQTLNTDAGHINDVAWSDSEIPVDELTELDELDELADLDMDELDFDDIDFDDVDVTKMNLNSNQFQNETDTFDELNIDENYLDESENDVFEQEFQKMKAAEQKPEVAEEVQTTSPEEDHETQTSDIDALFQEIFDEPPKSDVEPSTESESTTDSASSDIPASSDTTGDMDDLFAMLGLDANAEMVAPVQPSDEIPDFEIPPEMADIQDIKDIEEKKNKKKKGFLDILFGEEEEDELSQEEEAALAKKKEEKQEAKLKKKEENKAKKAVADQKKNQEKKEKNAKLAAKKAARKAADEKALAEDGPEKKLNKPLSVIIVIFFLILCGVIVLGTNIFDYKMVITKAGNYFERQKYGLAYREILGVEVKDADKKLESQIYTVMYVERQLEAYENYKKMNCPDLALDALLQGLTKYDAYYDEATTLGITEDMNYAKNEILTTLGTIYGINEEEANTILQLDNIDYSEQIQVRSAGIDFKNNTENTVEDVTE